MKNIGFTAFLLSALTLLPHHGAIATEKYPIENHTEKYIFDEDDKGFSYGLAEDAKEEVALKLFVKNTASEHELHDISADDLNRINPAAGIKLQFGF